MLVRLLTETQGLDDNGDAHILQARTYTCEYAPMNQRFGGVDSFNLETEHGIINVVVHATDYIKVDA